jgi:hypothetical protein
VAAVRRAGGDPAASRRIASRGGGSTSSGRCDEPVASLVIGDDPCRLLLIEEAVGSGEALRTDDHLRRRRRREVAKPVGVGAEGADHDRFGTSFPIRYDFEDSATAQASATPGMDQQQEPASEQPSAPPTVQIYRRAKEAAQRTTSRPPGRMLMKITNVLVPKIKPVIARSPQGDAAIPSQVCVLSTRLLRCARNDERF